MWPECGKSRPVTREGAEEYGILPEGGESTEGKAEGNADGKGGVPSLTMFWVKSFFHVTASSLFPCIVHGILFPHNAHCTCNLTPNPYFIIPLGVG